MIIVSKVF